jgi:hypothetical protein
VKFRLFWKAEINLPPLLILAMRTAFGYGSVNKTKKKKMQKVK